MKSGAGGYVAAALTALAGIAGAVGLVASAVLSIPEGVRFRAPGTTTFVAAAPGRYVLWHEHRTIFENRTWNRDPRLPDGARFRIVGPSGAELPLDRSAGATWKDGNTERISIGSFEAHEPGRYAVVVEGAMEPAVLSVAREFLWQMIGAIAGAVMLAMLGVGGAAALALYTFARQLDAGPKMPAAPGAAFSAARPAADAEKPLRELATVVYALQAASVLFGVTSIAGVIINYLKRDEVAGTWLESHFTWQIRTFWWTLAWGAIGLLTAIVLVGILVLFGAAVWFIYRVARGWIALSERRPIG